MQVFELRDIIRNSTSPADAALIDWDPYATTSSFYGPGALLCWLLVTVSYITKWVVAGSLLPEGLPGSMWLTSDFVAMVAYPLVAAGDAVIRAALLSPAARPHLMATMVAVRSNMNATTITPEVATDMDTLRACVGLSAPLRVCEVFLVPACIFLVVVLWDEPERGKLRLRSPLLWADMAFAATVLALLVATIVVAAVGTPGAIGDYLACVIASQIAAYFIIIATPGMPICGAWWYLANVVQVGHTSMFLGVWNLISLVCSIGPLVLVVLIPDFALDFFSLCVPDSGVSMGELDQAAAVCVGVFTLGITAYDVSGDIPMVAGFVRRSKIRLGLLREEREDEMPLTGDSGDTGDTGDLESQTEQHPGPHVV
ncbi:hypothetical protein C8A01DRAFT_40298 [Parachaetomium inaequale]|uniref:Uncharacterized protein n=1 Tax=Parachaetomium inaequale TaxID=2588326 RepID=A0AAN6P9F4_9PEZI|nr:hypothetical protein C8A01DRAFT_40298 [Parachaetomium inaequale]